MAALAEARPSACQVATLVASERLPPALSGSTERLPGLLYLAWRQAIIAGGLAVALRLWLIISMIWMGMLMRTGPTDPATVSALGVDIHWLLLVALAFGAMLAGFAGAMTGSIQFIDLTMGDTVLVLAFVVIVVGGFGAIRGTFIAALLVGLADTLGRMLATDVLNLIASNSAASVAGPAPAFMLICIVMALVLTFRPSGLSAQQLRERHDRCTGLSSSCGERVAWSGPAHGLQQSRTRLERYLEA